MAAASGLRGDGCGTARRFAPGSGAAGPSMSGGADGHEDTAGSAAGAAGSKRRTHDMNEGWRLLALGGSAWDSAIIPMPFSQVGKSLWPQPPATPLKEG